VSADRIVFGATVGGVPIVRYGRAGKWYVEPDTGRRQLVSVADAARLAAAGRAVTGQPGGAQFDATVRRWKGRNT
jgi:hypothetical protein